MHADALAGGFASAPEQSSRVFRAALDAMSRPGTIVGVAGAAPPKPLSPAAGALILTLCDRTTPLFLAPSHDTAEVRQWIAFHCAAPIVAADAASFAVGTWAALAPLDRFSIGTPEYPDRSATLIAEMETLVASGPRLTGPGIRNEARLSLPETQAFRANAARFPLGWDMFLTAGNQIAALPRTTKVEAA